MNILFFYFQTIAPTRGGVERVTSILADYFEVHGHRVFYLASTDKNSDASHETRQFFLPDLNRQTSQNFNFYKNFLAEKEIGVVVFQGAHESFPWKKFDRHPPLICALHLDPAAYVTIVQDKAVFKFRQFSQLQRRIARPIWRKIVIPAKIALRRFKKKRVYCRNYEQCDKFIILSAAYHAALAAHLPDGDSEDKIRCIPNPCSYEATEEHFEKEKILLYVGRLSLNQKRPDLMLEIWSKLAGQFPDWRLEILGDGDDAGTVKEYAREKKIPRVYFRGFVPPESYFKKAPFLCMTSSNEGFGMVLLEASAFGCVPVAFDAFPSVRDILKDEETGYLIPPLDVDAYAQKLRFLMSGNFPENIADNCRENARRYSIEYVGKEWLKLFEELCSCESGKV